MSRHIQVAYATRYGSTREAATIVAETLRETGIEVRLDEARALKSLDGARALILGSPLYFGSWRKEIRALLSREAEALSTLPFALFALGPTGPDPEEFAAAEEALKRKLASFPALVPISSAVFAGRYDPERLGLAHRLLALLPASPLHGMGFTDARDAAAIRAWAQSLVGKLP